MGGLTRDVGYAMRTLTAQPGLSLVAVLTLALGIAATTVVFSVVNGALLRPLPYAASERLVDVMQTWQDDGPGPTSPPNFRDWRDRARTFESMAAYYRGSANLSGDGSPVRLDTAFVTAAFFSVMRAEPSPGRGFMPSEDRPDADKVVVISHGFWQSHLGGRGGVLGERLRLNGESHTIVGVAPPGFGFPAGTELWLPAAFDYDNESRSFGYIRAVGRLAPGRTLTQARAEMDRVAAELEQEYPEHNWACGAEVELLGDRLAGAIRPALWMLLGSVGLVLMVATANVASLLLARATSRRKELAIRRALGASRPQIARLAVAESLVLSVCGGGLGVALAVVGTDALLQRFAAHIPRAGDVGVDGHVLAFVAAVAIATGLIASVLPAFEAVPDAGLAPLQEAGRSVTGSVRGSKTLRALVMTEVGLAVVLLIGAVLLMRSFANLISVEPGFSASGVLVADLELADSKYDDEQQRAGFYRDVLDRLAVLPGTEGASTIYPVPLDGGFTLRFTIAAHEVTGPADRPQSNFRIAGPGYFETMGVPRIKGRVFRTADTFTSERVAVVNRTFAERFAADGDPVGQRVSFDRDTGAADTAWFTVVGVVGDVRASGLASEPGPEIYVCSTQVPYSHLSLVVRTSGRPAALADSVRSAVLGVDGNLPVFDIRTIDDVVAGSLGRNRFTTALLGFFAAVALLLASIGVYGVLSYTASQRTREVSVRLALGAPRAQVLKLVARQGMSPVASGTGIGLVAALGLARVLSSHVFGVSCRDPLTFATVAATLLLVAVLASVVPAVRMTRLDAAALLRHE